MITETDIPTDPMQCLQWEDNELLQGWGWDPDWKPAPVPPRVAKELSFPIAALGTGLCVIALVLLAVMALLLDVVEFVIARAKAVWRWGSSRNVASYVLPYALLGFVALILISALGISIWAVGSGWNSPVTHTQQRKDQVHNQQHKDTKIVHNDKEITSVRIVKGHLIAVFSDGSTSDLGQVSK